MRCTLSSMQPCLITHTTPDGRTHNDKGFTILGASLFILRTEEIKEMGASFLCVITQKSRKRSSRNYNSYSLEETKRFHQTSTTKTLIRPCCTKCAQSSISWRMQLEYLLRLTTYGIQNTFSFRKTSVTNVLPFVT